MSRPGFLRWAVAEHLRLVRAGVEGTLSAADRAEIELQAAMPPEQRSARVRERFEAEMRQRGTR